MTEKEKFLEKVTSLFILHGAKSLTMDDISKEFSMSKKTLYAQYKNKEDLLIEVLDYILDTIIDRLKLAELQDLNPLEKMLKREKDLEQISKSKKNLFMRQLVKYYPAIFNAHLLTVHSKVSQIIINNINRGREMGIYRTDFDAELYSKFMLHLHISPDSSPLFEKETSEENLDCFCQETMIFYLSAIVTEKGAQILNTLK